MKLMRVGVDLAKSVFHVHGVDRREQVVWRRRLTRANWLKVFLATVEPGCEVGMEACGGAHHLSTSHINLAWRPPNTKFVVLSAEFIVLRGTTKDEACRCAASLP